MILLTGAYVPGGKSLHPLFGLLHAVSLFFVTATAALCTSCGTAVSVPGVWLLRRSFPGRLPRLFLPILPSTPHIAARTCAHCTSRLLFSARSFSTALSAVAFLLPPTTLLPACAPALTPCSAAWPPPFRCAGDGALDSFALAASQSRTRRSLSFSSTVSSSSRCASASPSRRRFRGRAMPLLYPCPAIPSS